MKKLNAESVCLAILVTLLCPLTAVQASTEPADSVVFCGVGHEQWRRDHIRPASKRPANLNVGAPRTVRMIYFLPNDRPYRQEIVDSMKVRIRQVQSFFIDQMEANGYGRRALRIETDTQGEPMVHRLNGQHPDSHYLDNTHVVYDEIDPAYDIERNIYVVVVDNSIDAIGIGGGRRAGGTGGRRGKSGGSALVPGDLIFDTVAHELGHACGLSHDFHDGSYIMSYGPGQSRLSACHAEFLSVHPYFNPNIPVDFEQKDDLPTIELISSRAYPAGSQRVSIHVKAIDSNGLSQVLLFGRTMPPHFAASFLEVIACRGLDGQREAIIEFEYDGSVPSALSSSLAESVAHPIRVAAIDRKGNERSASLVLAETSPHQVATLEWHESGVSSVVFSPGAPILATGSRDRTITIWHTGTSKPIAALRGHKSVVNSVAFSSDGATLASASSDQTIRLWNLTKTAEIGRLIGHSKGVRSVAFRGSDEDNLASGSDDGAVILWDLATRKPIFTRYGHVSGVNSVSFSPDGSILASGSRDGTVILWDVASGDQTATLEGHAYGVNSVSFSPDGAALASGSSDDKVILWDVETRNQIGTLEGHNGNVNSVSFSAGGALLATGGQDGTVILWDVLTREKITTFGYPGEVLSVSSSAGGALLAAGGRDGGVGLWDVSEWAGPRPFALEIVSGDGQQGTPGAPLAKRLVVEVRDQYGDLLPDARVRFAVTAGDGQLSGRFAVEHTTTDAEGRAGLILTLGPYPGMNAVGVSIRGLELARFTAEGVGVTVDKMDDVHRTWHLPKGASVRLGKGGLGGAGNRVLAYSADGRYLAAASDIGVWLYEAATFRALALLPSDRAVHSVAFSLDGTLAAGMGGRVELWEAETGERIGTLSHTGRGKITAVAFSPDGTTLVAMSTDDVIMLWDWETERLIGSWQAGRVDATQVSPVAFSPDGTRLVSGSSDGAVRLWDAATLGEVATLRGHTGAVNSVLYSPDGALLASVGGFSGNRGWHDFTIRLWDAATLREVARLRGHTGGVYSLSFSPDGATLVSCSRDRTVRLWDVATRTSITTMEHTSVVNSVLFSPDGATLVLGADNGVWLHDMEMGNVVELPGHDGPFWSNSLALSPEGALLATASEGSGDYEIKLWDLMTVQPAGTLKGLEAVTAVAFSSDGALLAAGALSNGSRSDPTAMIWNVETRIAVGPLKGGYGDGVTAVLFSPDGALLATGTRSGKVALWNVETRELIAVLEGHTSGGRVEALSFSPDGALLASGGFDRTVILWDVAAQEAIAGLEGYSGRSRISAVSFSPDGSLLATAAATIKLWDVDAREQIATLEAAGTGKSLSFSRDGTLLACGAYRQIKLWDVATRRVSSILDLNNAALATSVILSPDGILISGMSDGTILLWDLQPAPQTLDKASGDEQEGAAGAALAESFVVKVRDQNGNPLEGVEVTFAVSAGGGRLFPETAVTDSSGRASTTLTLGTEPGTNIVAATVSGIQGSVRFTAKALATPDFDGDGTVGFSDFVQFAGKFGLSQGDTGFDARFDLDGNGAVGFSDFLIFAGAFGKS